MRDSRKWEESIRKEVIEAENNYVKDPTPEKQQIWLNLQGYRIAIIRKAENKRLSQKQCSFGEGESVGQMLANLVKANSPSSAIKAIRTTNGEISSLTTEMVDTFNDYYKKLYKSQRVGEEEEINTFLEKVEILTITQKDREELEPQKTLREVQQVVAGMVNQKSPGPDGLPVETYKYYGEILLPELLRTLRGAELEVKPPASML